MDTEGEVDEFTSKSFAKTHALDLDAMISCKTGHGVNEAIEKLAKLIHEKSTENTNNSTPQDRSTIVIGQDDSGQRETTNGGGCSC